MKRVVLLVLIIAALGQGSQAEPAAGPWIPDLGDGTIKNPVIFADCSDPDVLRVGVDFCLTASSFANVPAMPILHSQDLVNWTIIGHAAPGKWIGAKRGLASLGKHNAPDFGWFRIGE